MINFNLWRTRTEKLSPTCDQMWLMTHVASLFHDVVLTLRTPPQTVLDYSLFSDPNQTALAPLLPTATWHRPPELTGLDSAEIPPPDLLLSSCLLHAYPDPSPVFAHVRARLQPGGLVLAALWGDQTLANVQHTITQAELALTNGAAPRFHPLPTPATIAAALQGNGFALPVVQVHPVTVRYATLKDLIQDLRAMGQTNILEAQDSRPPPCDLFTRAEHALKGHRDYFETTYEIVLVTAFAPG